MKRYLNEIPRDMKLYKNVNIMLGDKSNRTSDYSIYLLGNSRDVIYDIYKNDLFSKNFIKAYFTPRVIKLTAMRNQKIKNNQKNQYNFIKKKCPMLRYTRPRISNYDNRNVYIDLYKINQEFDSKYASTSKRKKANIYQNILKEMIGVNHNKKAVIAVPVDQKIKNTNKGIINQLFTLVQYNDLDSGFFSDITFIFFSRHTNRLFKTQLRNKNQDFDLPRFKKLLNILYNLDYKIILNREEQEEIDESDQEEEAYKETLKSRKKRLSPGSKLKLKISKGMNLTATSNKQEMQLIKMIDKKITDTEKKMSKESNIEFEKDQDEVLEDLMNQDDEFLGYLQELKEQRLQKLEEDELMKKKVKLKEQQEKAFDDVDDLLEDLGNSIDDIINDYESKSIEVEEINIDTINEELKKSRLREIDRNYNEKQADKDLVKVLTSFNEDPDFPLYVMKFDRKDSSDNFNKKETLSIKYKDVYNTTHHVTIDLPLLIDDRFFFLNNGKKTLSKQLSLLPILKTDSDMVQLTSNYKSKISVSRFGQKTDPNVDRFKKFIDKELKNYPSVKYYLGSSKGVNEKYTNTLEYDEISQYLLSLEFETFKFIFNREEILDVIYEKELVKDIDSIAKDGEYPFGLNELYNLIYFININDSRIYVRNTHTGKLIREHDTIVDAIVTDLIANVDEDIGKVIAKQSSGKRYVYSRARLLNTNVALIFLLGFYYGLEKVLNTYGIKYTFSEKPLKLGDDKTKYNRIRFADGHFYYQITPLRHAILVNGLNSIDMREYKFADFNKQDVYLDIFELLYDNRNTAKGLQNIMDLFLDPITKDVLKHMGAPTDMLNLLLYANTLLEDSSSKRLNDLQNYRIRSNELIYAELYNVLADTYRVYKDSSKRGSPIKMSVPKDALIKKLLESQLLDEFSTLNPVLEAEKLGTVTYKGLGGTNLDQAFTVDMRAYDKSMMGSLGINTPDSSKVGIVRQLSYDPNIINTRGMIEPTEDVNELDAYNIMTPAELLSPFTNLHADAPRVGMQVTQSKHLIPTEKSSKPLFGTGVERTLPYILGSDFIIRAKQDGEVKLLDTEAEIMILKYKDGTEDVIDLSPIQAKNSNGGFYITNEKDAMVKEGDKFKKDEIIAKNDDYFKGSTEDDVMFTPGYLTKVALHSGDYTLEDSSLVTTNLTHDLSSNITMKKEVGGLGVNTNILHMLKRGDLVKTGEPLIIFEQSFDEGAANKLLDGLDEEFDEILDELGKNKILSKQTGKIVDMKIYWNKDIEEFSPSVQKIIKDYIKSIEKRKKLAGHSSSLIFPPTEKINTDKIGSSEIDGIHIEYYIRYNDVLSIGDKITFDTAVKTIVSDVVNPGEEPYSEYRKDESIDAIVSPLSVVSRMTTDIFNKLFLNKCIIELKRQVTDMWNE